MAGDTMKDGPAESSDAQPIPEGSDRGTDAGRVSPGLGKGVLRQGHS